MLPLKEAQITYPYGEKNNSYQKGYHTGIDMVSNHLSVYACLPGTVQEARFAPGAGADPGGWGNYVIFRTVDQKYDILHAHLSKVQVAKGQAVAEGTALGVIGSTGKTTGPHLHFEVRRAPWSNWQDIDPAAFLGIYNRVGPIESIPAGEERGGKNMFKVLILCNPGPDERAAGYLGDYFKAPVCLLSNVTRELLESAGKVYVVGSKEKVTANAVNIVGSNRYDTCRQVIDICLGK